MICFFSKNGNEYVKRSILTGINESVDVILDKEAYFKNNLIRSKGVGYNNYVDFNNDNCVNGKDFAILNY